MTNNNPFSRPFEPRNKNNNYYHSYNSTKQKLVNASPNDLVGKSARGLLRHLIQLHC